MKVGSGPLWQKRVLDLLLSVPALVLALPVIATCYIVARAETGEPGFFVQERIGKAGCPFRVLKIRTMRTRDGGPTTTTANDERVMRLGRWMRKYKLDELPQLINVIEGTMSLVGPRPTVREDYERMTAEHRKRYAVPPGVTGLAQVSGNTSLSWPERIHFDLVYVERVGILLDLKIIARTLLILLTGRIETHPASEDEWR